VVSAVVVFGVEALPPARASEPPVWWSIARAQAGWGVCVMTAMTECGHFTFGCGEGALGRRGLR